jgi:hypothetical protein
MLKILPTLDSYGGPKLQKQEGHCIISQLAPARRSEAAILERVLILAFLDVTDRSIVSSKQ